MTKLALGLVLATFAGAAAAGDLSEPRYYESNDYSARVYYRVDFGGDRGHAQSVGLRFDSVRAEAIGAPSLFQARFTGAGLDRLALNGVDLRGMMLSSNQMDGDAWRAMTPGQWAAVGLAGVVFGLAVVGAVDGADDPSTGTGGS